MEKILVKPLVVKPLELVDVLQSTALAGLVPMTPAVIDYRCHI